VGKVDSKSGIKAQGRFKNPFTPIRLLRIFILQLLRGDFCTIGTSRHVAVVPNDGRDRSEADMPRASRPCGSDQNDPYPMSLHRVILLLIGFVATASKSMR